MKSPGTRELGTSIWVLGSEPRTFAREACAFHRLHLSHIFNMEHFIKHLLKLRQSEACLICCSFRKRGQFNRTCFNTRYLINTQMATA